MELERRVKQCEREIIYRRAGTEQNHFSMNKVPYLTVPLILLLYYGAAKDMEKPRIRDPIQT